MRKVKDGVLLNENFHFTNGRIIFLTRVANKPLSSQQEKFVNLDDASRQSMNILSSIGAKTGVDFKDKEEVKAFFETGKTINPEDYGK